MTNTQPNRRTAIKSLLAISSLGALAACGKRKSQSGKTASATLKYAAKGKFLDLSEVGLLSALAQTIIPRTTTPSAVDVGVPQTLQDLLSNWGDDNVRLYWREGLSQLSDNLKQAAGQDFAKASELQQNNVLGKYDAQAAKGEVDDPFYLDMKRTIATAYYMSEAGATEELHYDPVPGDWKGDVPFSEIGKAWAT